jgi:beta-ribofuranosylaminobenzene 5'-phosphate synthase
LKRSGPTRFPCPMLIKARARIHISLIDMGFASPRSFGGIGFSIEHPTTIIRMTTARRVQFRGFDSLDERCQTGLRVLARRLSNFVTTGYVAELLDHPPQHAGFGSQTSLSMAIVAAVNHLFNLQKTRPDQQLLSGRGGASGVGLHCFFDGGIVWDGGHKRSEITALHPSGASKPSSIPPMMLRVPFPDSWKVVLVAPKGSNVSGQDEIDFFRKNTPVDRREALETIACMYHGLLPSFVEVDYASLAESLKQLHAWAFKKAELALQPAISQAAVRKLHELGYAAGVSSMGPLIYVIRPQEDLALESIRACFAEESINELKVVAGFNSGFEIIE